MLPNQATLAAFIISQITDPPEHKLHPLRLSRLTSAIKSTGRRDVTVYLMILKRFD